MKITSLVALAVLACAILPKFAFASEQYATTYYGSGAVHCKTPYLNGRKDGTETCFYETGIRKTEIVYEKGTERLFTWYAPDGKPLMCNEFDAQHKLTQSKTWYASGVLKNITPYRDGVRHGLFREYNQDGSLKTEILYENDIQLSVAHIGLPRAHGHVPGAMPAFASEEELDLYCLKASYPEIRDTRRADDGALFLLLSTAGGPREILYATAARPQEMPENHVTDVRTSMALPYPLEPLRPDLPDRFSPGRWRSMELITALYGDSREEVLGSLVRVPFRGKSVSVGKSVARALADVNAELAQALAEDKSLRTFLNISGSAGGFVWRRVAGESYMSPHAYGLAIDLSPEVATYWKWSKLRPHPLQKTYPARIVEIFEKHGFIWGGKWHEYDMMHFEYRPELICKAKNRQYLQQ